MEELPLFSGKMYALSFLLMLMVVREKLDHIRRVFLWERCDDRKKLPLMKMV